MNAEVFVSSRHEPAPSDHHRSLERFELLHASCPLPDERQFWRVVGDGIRSIEQGMDGESLTRFEFGIERILAQHGLPPWGANQNGAR